MLSHLWRLLTDKRVRCVRCSSVVGYVCREGHAEWLCADCSDTGAAEAA